MMMRRRRLRVQAAKKEEGEPNMIITGAESRDNVKKANPQLRRETMQISECTLPSSRFCWDMWEFIGVAFFRVAGKYDDSKRIVETV